MRLQIQTRHNDRHNLTVSHLRDGKIMLTQQQLKPHRTGGRVVDCTGLENPYSFCPRSAEMAHSLGKWATQDALFALGSTHRVGTLVGTGRLAHGEGRVAI